MFDFILWLIHVDEEMMIFTKVWSGAGLILTKVDCDEQKFIMMKIDREESWL